MTDVRRAMELAGLILGGGDAAGQGASRLVDVHWSAPVWTGAAVEYPADTPRDGLAFGGVRLDTPLARDWVCFAQPLGVLPEPNAFWPNPDDVGHWQVGDEPGPWWPEQSPVARSPFVLEVTAGPEGGVIQRFPVPAVGLAVALRGANVSATLRYDRGAIGTISAPPYEPPGPQTGGRGKIQLVVTPGNPAPCFKNVQTRRVYFGPPVLAGGLPGWFPAFATRVVPTDLDPWTMNYRTPTGAGTGNTFETQLPHQAVAVAEDPGDPTVPRAVTVEVFA